MTLLYQPPLIPGLGSQTGPIGPGSHAPAKNPFFTVANQFLPRNLHDVIRWVRFITVQSPVTTEVLRKLATYPITSFTHTSRDPIITSKYEDIIRSFRLKTSLHNIGFQYFTVGNVFVSLYFPIVRTYGCPHCKTLFGSENSSFLKFKNYKFIGTCANCQQHGTFVLNDTKGQAIEDMNIIVWDPLNITVNHNPITGKSDYYYSIPNDVKRRVLEGDRLLIDSLPWEFIEAVRDNKDFKFDRDRIFHLKNVDMGFSIGGVAVPPLVSHFSLVFYQATLRRANESIASDFMAPMRVIFPQAQSTNSDPVVAISMRHFVAKMEEAFVRHKQDNSSVLISPVPVGYQPISGEGKTLLVNQEISQAEESLLLSMGVSRELLSGTTNWTSSTVGLRMLKNTLDSYVGQLEELLDWIFSKASGYLGIQYSKVGISPFQLTDDEILKTLVLQLSQSGSISMSTVYESMGRSYEQELEKILNDAKIKARHDVRLKFEVERAQFIEGMEINKINNKDDSYMQVFSDCQNIANQLLSADQSTSQQVLNELRQQDYAKYVMVSKLLEEGRRLQTAEVNSELANQTAQAGSEQGKEPTDQNNSPPSNQGSV